MLRPPRGGPVSEHRAYAKAPRNQSDTLTIHCHENKSDFVLDLRRHLQVLNVARDVRVVPWPARYCDVDVDGEQHLKQRLVLLGEDGEAARIGEKNLGGENHQFHRLCFPLGDRLVVGYVGCDFKSD